MEIIKTNKMKNFLFIAIVFVFIVAVGCSKEQKQQQVQQQIPPSSDEQLCVKLDSDASMTLTEAIDIANKSDCVAEGELLESFFCNEDTGTWWIDLEIDKPGCAPACVIDVEKGSAEINWRCTGLIPE